MSLINIFTKGESPIFEVYFGIIILIAVLIFSIKKMKESQKGFPETDEMTKKRSRMAAAASFYVIAFVIFYLVIMPDEPIITMDVIRRWGTSGMMGIYGICWLVIKFIGVRNE